MKTILKTTMVSLITLLFINCNNSNSKVVSQTNEPSNKLEKYKIIDISKSEYEKLLSSAFKFDLDTSLLVKKNEGTIKLALDNGSFKTFSDTLVNTDNADTKEYFYKGVIKGTEIYVIYAKFFETSDYLFNSSLKIKRQFCRNPVVL